VTQLTSGGGWEAHSLFKQRVQHLPTSKNSLSLYYISVSATCVFDDSLVCYRWTFFFPSSLFSPENYSLSLLVIGISTSVLILLIFYFWSWPFYKSFICFQLHSSIPIYEIIIFFNLILILWISIFFHWFFCKSFIEFQCYPSIQIDSIIFSNLVLIVLIFNFFLGHLVKVIILFNFTLQSKHCFYFLC